MLALVSRARTASGIPQRRTRCDLVAPADRHLAARDLAQPRSGTVVAIPAINLADLQPDGRADVSADARWVGARDEAVEQVVEPGRDPAPLQNAGLRVCDPLPPISQALRQQEVLLSQCRRIGASRIADFPQESSRPPRPLPCRVGQAST